MSRITCRIVAPLVKDDLERLTTFEGRRDPPLNRVVADAAGRFSRRAPDFDCPDRRKRAS